MTLNFKRLRWPQRAKNHSAVLDYSLNPCKVFLRDCTGRNHTFRWKALQRLTDNKSGAHKGSDIFSFILIKSNQQSKPHLRGQNIVQSIQHKVSESELLSKTSLNVCSCLCPKCFKVFMLKGKFIKNQMASYLSDHLMFVLSKDFNYCVCAHTVSVLQRFLRTLGFKSLTSNISPDALFSKTKVPS